MARGHSGKRARVVCFRCHGKKIRCDLQLTSNGTSRARCGPCSSAGAECEFRPSNKGRRPKKELPRQISRSEVITSARTPPTRSDGRNVGEIGSEQGLSNEDHASPHRHVADVDEILPTLQQSYLETYWEYIYPWCPIIDPGPDIVVEPLLQHVMALLSGSIKESLLPHANPRQHYERARYLFYNGVGIDPMTRTKAALLLSYSSAGPPNVGSMETAFWWIGTAIRLAQDIGLHREPPQGASKEDSGLRRRIWWTLYARERTIAICQGQPCIIDEDCTDVGIPVQDDFPLSCTRQALVFKHWIDLCRIIGSVNKQMFGSRRAGSGLPTHEIAGRLTRWLRALPPELRLPISTDRTTTFDRHVHLLHLPYLATIALVYLNTSQRLPEACVAAVIAGASIARIFEDLLARGCVRFILEQGGWYIAIAGLSLRPLRSLNFLSTQAGAQLRLLTLSLKQLVPISHSAKMIEAGLDKLLNTHEFEHALRIPISGHDQASNPARSQPSTLNDLCAGDGVVWSEFFPFVTVQTNSLLKSILTECQSTFPELWPEVDFAEFNDLLEEFRDVPVDWSSSSVPN